MAKPVKYTERRTARFDKETDDLLVKQSKIMSLGPAVVIRVIVEHTLKGKPIKEATK